MIDKDTEGNFETVWARVAVVRRVTAKVKPRHELKRPRILVRLPTIPEETQFMSLLDPLTEQLFKVEHI